MATDGPTWQQGAINHEWGNQQAMEKNPHDLRYPAMEIAVAARTMEQRYGNVDVLICQTPEVNGEIVLTIKIRRKK